MQQRNDSAEWVLRTTRRILRDVGPKAARRFLDSRGGPTKWEHAAREIARHVLQKQVTQPGDRNVPLSIRFMSITREPVESIIVLSSARLANTPQRCDREVPEVEIL